MLKMFEIVNEGGFDDLVNVMVMSVWDKFCYFGERYQQWVVFDYKDVVFGVCMGW